jgi:hypothetical protein
MNELEEGIHSYRRQIRWFGIYAEASDGLFELREDRHPIAKYKSGLDSDLAKSKYCQLPPPNPQLNTVSYSKSLYVATMESVLALGDIKDRGELLEGLAHSYVECGHSPSLKEARVLVESLTGYNAEQIQTQAHHLYAKHKKVGHARAMQAELEAALGA